MAIVKMKHIRLYGLRSAKDDILKRLQHLGCVEVSEPRDLLEDDELSGKISMEMSQPEVMRTKQAKLQRGIELLDRYAPAKSKLLSAKPAVGEDEFLDEARLSDALQAAEGLEQIDSEIKRLNSKIVQDKNSIESLNPWVSMDSPLSISGTENTDIMYLTAPASIPFGEIEAAVAKDVPEAQLFLISSGKELHYMQLISIKDKTDDAVFAIRQYGVSPAPISGFEGTASESIEALNAEIEADTEKIAALSENAKVYSDRRQDMKLAYDLYSTLIFKEEAEGKLAATDSVFILEGWVTAPDVPEMEKALADFPCAFELKDPVEEEYPEVPVKLKNNKITNALNMVTNMYSLPQYGTVDPNPLMAPFFILFYGMMMCDMGYGLLMVIAALVAMKKIKPQAGSLSFCQLLLYSGIATIFFGALTGGFFGDAPYRVVQMINPESTWQGLPKLFDPLNDSLLVLGGAMGLGILHLNVGMIVSFVQKCKHGQVLDGILYEGALWIILAGIILFAGDMLLSLGTKQIGIIVMIVGALALFIGSMRGKKGISKFTSVFGTLYNEITGWFGDILSYSRLMALMLAGSVIAMVFNMIATLFNNVFVFIIIFLIGHVLNMGLNLLGCYVHDLRLQCLEYFGKFYVDGGREFDPLSIKSKYVRVTKNI
jgi:V/A-type H+-transporting ATPase subunit I